MPAAPSNIFGLPATAAATATTRKRYLQDAGGFSAHVLRTPNTEVGAAPAAEDASDTADQFGRGGDLCRLRTENRRQILSASSGQAVACGLSSVLSMQEHVGR